MSFICVLLGLQAVTGSSASSVPSVPRAIPSQAPCHGPRTE